MNGTSNTMVIHAHILAWNEEKILPFTLDHYSQFCNKIFIYDNMSDDGSDEIYKRYDNVTVIKWESGNTLDDLKHAEIKNNAYKQTSMDCDWVIVCDCDELLYHPQLLDKLEEYKKLGVGVPRISGHDMFSETFPEYDGGLITDKIKIGSHTHKMRCKNIVFNPKLDIEYSIGGHLMYISDRPILDEEFSEKTELKLLHYKYLSKEYITSRYKILTKRLSQFNTTNGFGIHYMNLPMDYMDELKETGFKVIS